MSAADPHLLALTEICHATGLEVGDAAKHAQLEQVDLFEVVHLRSLGTLGSVFANLTEISVIHAPNLRSLAGVASCARLARLFVVECKISRIDIGECPNLVTLNLDGNEVSSLEGLGGCTALESLWVNNNRIPEVRRGQLPATLRELHIARNRIGVIGDGLVDLQRLETLQIAGNQLGSFEDMASLAQLPRLREVSFADPHWGDNLFNAYSNYSTYALFQLANAAVLDGAPVTPDVRAAAESTFLKKRMYYNMRCKTLRRNTVVMMRCARAIVVSLAATLSLSLPALEHACAVLESQLALVDSMTTAPRAAAATGGRAHAGSIGGSTASTPRSVSGAERGDSAGSRRRDSTASSVGAASAFSAASAPFSTRAGFDGAASRLSTDDLARLPCATTATFAASQHFAAAASVHSGRSSPVSSLPTPAAFARRPDSLRSVSFDADRVRLASVDGASDAGASPSSRACSGTAADAEALQTTATAAAGSHATAASRTGVAAPHALPLTVQPPRLSTTSLPPVVVTPSPLASSPIIRAADRHSLHFIVLDPSHALIARAKLASLQVLLASRRGAITQLWSQLAVLETAARVVCR